MKFLLRGLQVQNIHPQQCLLARHRGEGVLRKIVAFTPTSTSECSDLLRSQLDPHTPLKLHKVDEVGLNHHGTRPSHP